MMMYAWVYVNSIIKRKKRLVGILADFGERLGGREREWVVLLL